MNQILAHVELIRQSNTLLRFISTYIIGGTRRQYATAVLITFIRLDFLF